MRHEKWQHSRSGKLSFSPLWITVFFSSFKRVEKMDPSCNDTNTWSAFFYSDYILNGQRLNSVVFLQTPGAWMLYFMLDIPAKLLTRFKQHRIRLTRESSKNIRKEQQKKLNRAKSLLCIYEMRWDWNDAKKKRKHLRLFFYFRLLLLLLSMLSRERKKGDTNFTCELCMWAMMLNMSAQIKWNSCNFNEVYPCKWRAVLVSIFFFSINSNQQFYSWNFRYGWNCRLAYHVPRWKKETQTLTGTSANHWLIKSLAMFVCIRVYCTKNWIKSVGNRKKKSVELKKSKWQSFLCLSPTCAHYILYGVCKSLTICNVTVIIFHCACILIIKAAIQKDLIEYYRLMNSRYDVVFNVLFWFSALCHGKYYALPCRSVLCCAVPWLALRCSFCSTRVWCVRTHILRTYTLSFLFCVRLNFDFNYWYS